MKRFIGSASLALLMGSLGACTGTVGGKQGAGQAGSVGSSGDAGSTGNAGSPGNPGTAGGNGTGVGGGGSPSGTGGSIQTPPFQATDAAVAVRKVKNLLVGLAPTDAEVQTATSGGAGGLQTLINGWISDSQSGPLFQAKMIGFFRNFFQQTGFAPLDDFKMQMMMNGGFDFGPLGTGAVGDDVYFRMVQNIQDSFARTAWQLVADGRPFTEVLTTQRYQMTTALKLVYVQIDMPNDEPYASFGSSSSSKLAWKIDMSGTAIPLADTLNPSSPSYMVFDDQSPATSGGFALSPNCHGTAMVNQYGGSQQFTGGYSQLFQRLIGYTPRWTFVGNPQCFEHASKPYLTVADTADWAWVTVDRKTTPTDRKAAIEPYNLPALRAATSLTLSLPRVGFYTTPAFLALWNTNDSNQHRVTANQTLLVALGESFTSANRITPASAPGLDMNHSVAGSECVFCHQGLDPLRQFWATQYDFNDRNDFPANGVFNGSGKNPRPSTTGGVLAFEDVNEAGTDITALGTLLAKVSGTSDKLTRFAISVTQGLCFYANAASCLESDAEFRRVARAFQESTYDYPTLIRELFSSPLVTNISMTATTEANGVSISIARRDQICGALSARLGIADVCALAVPKPSSDQNKTLTIVNSVAADAFSRGSEIPVTPSDPTLFYRAASEMLCENLAPKVVDPSSGTNVYPSAAVTSSIAALVETIVGYPPADNHHDSAVQILTEHYNAALASSANTGSTAAKATNAMRSTFALACQSPTSLSFGL
jgi:hypothetical protein